ncbi:(deoxy)nucleoside triphosphate pyrophosphohydrolase [Sphingomonas sp.]|jgi:8-oxo-dGTP diphosphatase|uniref:(deoxy)nucleoside triphosphate pyrophosphohydrolase n=1 Tax=Sphingomonas sp. TaxID=28214 RepID=UPI002ED84C72
MADNATFLLPVVAAALIDGEGRVLLQQRPPGRAMAGLWEFPGGKIEARESPEQALIRELEEELGIVLAADALVATAFASAALDTRHLLLLLYAVRHWTGEPQALEATALAWVRPADMPAFPMPHADRPLVDALVRLLRD